MRKVVAHGSGNRGAKEKPRPSLGRQTAKDFHGLQNGAVNNLKFCAFKKMKILKYCSKSENEFKDFIVTKTIENLIVFVIEEDPQQVDLKLFYFKNKRLRYVSDGFFKTSNLKELLSSKGFTFQNKRYDHFDRDGCRKKNIFKTTESSRKLIVNVPIGMNALLKKCLALKKKMGRPKVKRKMAPRRKSIQREHQTIKERMLDVNSMPRKRQIPKLSVEDKKKRFKSMFSKMTEKEKEEITIFCMNNLEKKRQILFKLLNELN